MKITSYDTEFDIGALPEASVKALLSRGLNHVLGNEVASKVTGFKTVGEGQPEHTEAEIEAFKVTARQKAIDAILAGTLGVRAAGVTVDPVEAAMERITRDEITTTLSANKYKWSKSVKGEDRTVALPDVKFTMDELVERRLAKHGDRIRAAAEKAVKAKQRKLEEAAKTGVDL